VFTSEWDSYAQRTYMANFGGQHPINGDITQIPAEDIPDHDVILGGFPCQPFSIAGVSKKNALGRAHGFADETQGTLFFDVARIIAAKRPKAFMLENVKNLQFHNKGRTFDVILRTLRDDLGYQIFHKVIDGAHLVPQHRERIIIVGFRDPVDFNWDMVELPKKGTRTLGEIIHKWADEPALEADGADYYDHAKHRVQDKYTLTDKLWQYLQNYKIKHAAAGNGFGLVTKESVTRTLSARYYKDGSEILFSQGANKNPRRLTPRECARLMGFPDTFKIPVSDTQAYRLFSEAAVVPMVHAVGKLIASIISPNESTDAASSVIVPKNIMATELWTKEQIKLAFHLYCQIPYGRIHGRNPEIIALAKVIGRTSDAVAMKMLNIASIDPAITGTGRAGLGNASALDRAVWDEFHSDWERLAVECQLLRQQLDKSVDETLELEEVSDTLAPEDFNGETRQVLTAQRIKQHFFRRAVLSSYRGRCCMSGLSDSRLLIASHIVPWRSDKANRLNPSNGLCLSAIHDRAFDKGLICLADDLTIIIADDLKRHRDVFVKEVLVSLHGQKIEPPERFAPQPEFVAWHRNSIFLDNQK